MSSFGTVHKKVVPALNLHNLVYVSFFSVLRRTLCQLYCLICWGNNKGLKEKLFDILCVFLFSTKIDKLWGLRCQILYKMYQFVEIARNGIVIE